MDRNQQSVERLSAQRGASAILFALVLTVLLGFGALAVDLARLHLVKVELQNAADAAALAGARSLADPQVAAAGTGTSSGWSSMMEGMLGWMPGFSSATTISAGSGSAYNWPAARAAALVLARQNVANGSQLRDALVETGYWNLQNPSLGLRPDSLAGVPAAGDVPAVRVTITISDNRNNGPVKLFLAPILGIDQRDMHASAVAVIAAPAAGTGLFPFAISRNMYDTYWDSDKNRPELDSSNNPIALKFGMHSVYFDKNGNQYTSGTWTTFGTAPASADNVKKYLEQKLISNVTVGMSINIESGVDDAAFHKTGELYANKDVPIVVVEKVVPGKAVTLYAIGGFHIDGVDKITGKSYISGHFISPEIFGNLGPGSGNGINYGAYTPPILVD